MFRREMLFRFEIRDSWEKYRQYSTLELHVLKGFKESWKLFKLMFMQMTEASARSCDNLDSFRITAIKETVSSWPYELQNIIFKNVKTIFIPKLGSSLFHWIAFEGNNEFLKKSNIVASRISLWTILERQTGWSFL